MKPLQVTATANATLQNRINVSVVFHHIRECGPVYRAEIARELHLSAPAVSRAVEALKAEGYVVETDKVRTDSGKRATHLLVNSSVGWVIGIDLLKEPTKIAIANLQCDIVDEWEGFKLGNDVDVERELYREIEAVIARHGRREELKAISVGVPAVVDEAGTIATAFLYSSLEGLAVKDLLEERFGVPAFVENGVNLSALAEAKRGVGRNCRNFAFIEVSNGIGAGIVVERNLVHGRHGSAGEIGFIKPGGFSKPGNDGATHYLEEVASTEALPRKAVERVRAGARAPVLLERSGGGLESITAASVCAAALAGDELSRELLTEATGYLSTAVINLALVLDPERIILGGDICHLPGVEELFVEPIRHNLQEAVPFAVPELILSSLHDSAGVIGSAQLAVDSLLTGLYPYRMDQPIEKT